MGAIGGFCRRFGPGAGALDIFLDLGRRYDHVRSGDAGPFATKSNQLWEAVARTGLWWHATTRAFLRVGYAAMHLDCRLPGSKQPGG